MKLWRRFGVLSLMLGLAVIGTACGDGETSEPFRSQFGWHLLQVLSRRDQDKTLTNIEAQARKSIRKRKTDEELRLWLRRIRDEAYVEYIDKTLSQSE